MLSTAHIFYIPVILLVGIFAGYYIGRWAADREREERARAAKRRKALKE
jgi:hypothetical protein